MWRRELCLLKRKYFLANTAMWFSLRSFYHWKRYRQNTNESRFFNETSEMSNCPWVHVCLSKRRKTWHIAQTTGWAVWRRNNGGINGGNAPSGKSWGRRWIDEFREWTRFSLGEDYPPASCWFWRFLRGLWVDGWNDGWMERWMDGMVDGWIVRGMDRWMDGSAGIWCYICESQDRLRVKWFAWMSDFLLRIRRKWRWIPTGTGKASSRPSRLSSSSADWSSSPL